MGDGKYKPGQLTGFFAAFTVECCSLWHTFNIGKRVRLRNKLRIAIQIFIPSPLSISGEEHPGLVFIYPTIKLLYGLPVLPIFKFIAH